MAELEYFLVTSGGVGAISVDYVDLGTDPDEDIVYAFVNFIAREEPGTVHWLEGLSKPRGIQLDPVKARYAPEDGQLRTIIAAPRGEKQLVTVTANPFTLNFSGSPTANITHPATPQQVQAALEALPNIAVGDVYVSGVMKNEKQTVSFSGAPTGGHFLLLLSGEPTTPISRNASASSLQAALQALAGVGSDGCSVTGPIGGPWVVEFTGTLAGVDVPLMVGSLRSEVQVISFDGAPTGGQFQLSYSGQVTPDITYPPSAATLQTALENLSNLAPGDIVVTGALGGPYTVAFGGTLANKDVALITPITERNEVQTVAVTSGAPTGGTFILNYDGYPTAALPRYCAVGTMRAALEALPNLNPGDVSVSGGGLVGEGPWVVKFQGSRLGNLNVPQMTVSASLTPSGTMAVSTTTQGLGITGGTVTSRTTVEAVALSGGTNPAPTVASTVTGSAGTPFTVNFQGAYEFVDVPQMTGTNCTVSTAVAGTPDLGVKLVANTNVMDLGLDEEGNPVDLIYDVEFIVPDLDPLKEDRKINPFGIVAPRTGGAVVDLADPDLHVPPRER